MVAAYLPVYRVTTKSARGWQHVRTSEGEEGTPDDKTISWTIERTNRHRKQPGGSMRKKAKFRALTSNTKQLLRYTTFRSRLCDCGATIIAEYMAGMARPCPYCDTPFPQ